MEKLKCYNNQKKEEKQNKIKDKVEEINEENNVRYPKKYNNHKRSYKTKEKLSNKKTKTAQNSKNKNKNRRNYKKRTDLIQERIKILQLAKKNKDEEENNSNNNSNKKSIIVNRIINSDNKKDSKELQNEQNNLMFKSLKIDEINRNSLTRNNLIANNNNKYIKKIPVKTNGNSPKAFKKYQTSTFTNNKIENKKNDMIKNENEKYQINTYDIDKEKSNNSKDKENKLGNDMDIIGYKTGFIYKTKKWKDEPNLKISENNSPKNINSYALIKSRAKRVHKKYENLNLLIKSQTNKEIKDYDTENKEDIFTNKEKDLNNIYVPKKIYHLLRGSSQENIHNVKSSKSSY